MDGDRSSSLARTAMAVVAIGASLLAVAPAAADPSVLPFGRALAGDRTLPLPFGVGLTVYGQSQDYQLSRLEFDFPGVAIDRGAIAIDNSIQEVNAQLDAWLLPFLNLFAIAGEIDGTTNVDFSNVPALPVPLDRLRIEYNGEVYGLGITVAGGTDHYFGSLTVIWTSERLSGDFDSDAEAFLVTPRLGRQGEWGAVWIGTTYQDAQESHRGTITLPFLGPVGFDVELEDRDPWNLQVGASTVISEHWHLHVEGGVAKRLSAEFGATYRF